MNPIFRKCAVTIVAASAASFAMCASAVDVSAKLAGTEEVPPVKTMATGSAHFTVKDDMSISGSVRRVPTRPGGSKTRAAGTCGS